MNVDIFITDKSTKTKVQVPWLPESIEYEVGGMISATYDIINRGDVEIPSGTGLTKISWESQFPGKNRTDKAMMRGSWQSPDTYNKQFESWLTNGTTLNIIVTGYPINKDVYLSSYTATPAGGFGDMEYSVEFTEMRTIQITKTTKTGTKATKRPTNKKKTYTVKKKDTLWKIAKKTLGSGSKWKKIYTANKKIIEKTAKKKGYKSSNNGKRLFPGTKLTIPKG